MCRMRSTHNNTCNSFACFVSNEQNTSDDHKKAVTVVKARKMNITWQDP